MNSNLNKSILLKLNTFLPQNLIPNMLNKLNYIIENNSQADLIQAVNSEELVDLKGGEGISEDFIEEILSLISNTIIPYISNSQCQHNTQFMSNVSVNSNNAGLCDGVLDLNNEESITLELNMDMGSTSSAEMSQQPQQSQQNIDNMSQQDSMEVEFKQFVQTVKRNPQNSVNDKSLSVSSTTSKNNTPTPNPTQTNVSNSTQTVTPTSSSTNTQNAQSTPSTLDISKFSVGASITGNLYCTSCKYKDTSDYSKQLTLYCVDDGLHKISCRLKSAKLDTTMDFSNTLINIIGNVKDFHGVYIEIIQMKVIQQSTTLPSPTIDNLEEYVQRFTSLVNSVTNTEFKNLLEDIFYRNGYLDYYKKKASSISMHGVKAGDLLKHCVLVAEIADRTIQSGDYNLDRDLVILCALLHDIGKVYQMPQVGQTEYTLIGNLYGHIFMGAHIVLDLLSEDRYNIPSNKVMNIVHCLLSHHGKKEYGSPVEPCTPEAVLLNQADLTEAYMRHIVDALVDKQPQQQIKDFGKHIVKL